MSAPDFSTTPISRTPPVREDCWSEEATSTLIEAWGKRYLEMNRGNLRQKDWQDVADSVNSVHGLCAKTYRTDIQCKNRIDTVKKKFKSEKAKIDEANGGFVSSWVFYPRVEFLIGNSLKYQSRNNTNNGSSSNNNVTMVTNNPVLSLPSPPNPFAVSRKTAFPAVGNSRREVMALDMPPNMVAPNVVKSESGFKRNYAVMAAAAAKPEEEYDEEDEEVGNEGNGGEEDSWRCLAKAIDGFGEVYQKVESMKVEQMMELEKARMKFARDLEFQRMQMLVDMQVQFEKMTRGVKRIRRAGESDDDDYV